MDIKWWNIYLDGKLIDSVPYTEDCDKEYIQESLIKHDGYNQNIVVKAVKKA
ncbi:MAG: hypothetical protein ACOC2U_03530 [bacterium]